MPITAREISAGTVVFRRTSEGPKFLILYHGGDYWNFAKGHIEKEEKSLEAAIRETKEETGLGAKELRLIPQFRAHERFAFRRGSQHIFKIVIFYLAETRTKDIKISDEHHGYGWFTFRDAKKILGKYRDSQKVLVQAYNFLQGVRPPQAQREGHVPPPQPHQPHPPHQPRREHPQRPATRRP